MPKPLELRQAIAGSISANLKSYDVEEFCLSLGLAPAGENENPFNSKAVYVRSKLAGRGLPDLLRIAQRVLEEWDDPELQAIVEACGIRGVDGQMRNLIFASSGPKPRIVLTDSVDNVIDVVENAEHCLFYDRPLTEGGLSWSELVTWWAAQQKAEANHELAQSLWSRLNQSLDSEPEKMFFRAYTKRYQTDFDIPGLIPQVYLHYDPYTRTEARSHLVRQRMDFLLLLPGRRRVVIEIDGKHHYAKDDGTADPRAYAAMMAEDRALRLRGYEVHRFGGYEFVDTVRAEQVTDQFFDVLLSTPD